MRESFSERGAQSGWHDDSGETLVESLVSIVIVGTVLLALIGSVMLSGSLTTLLRAQSTSQVAGRAVYEAVSAYQIPTSTPLVAGGACNAAILTPLGSIVASAYASSGDTVTQPSAPTYSLVVISADANGALVSATYPCASLGSHPDSSAGEIATAIAVTLPVQSAANLAVQQANGSVTRSTSTFATTLTAYVYQGIA